MAIETLPEGCYQTYDRDGKLDHTTTVDLDPDEDYTKADFGYYCPTGTIAGTTSPVTGPGMLAGGMATVFASGAAWLNQRRMRPDKTIIDFTK